MQQALLAGILVALLCSYLGVYIVLKRIVFVGVALSEISAAGVALALFLGFSPLLGAMAFMMAGIGLLTVQWSPRRVPNDSFIGIVYVLASALAILLVAKSHEGETHMLQLMQGLKPAWWDLLLFFTIGLAIAFAIRAVGVLLATTLLIVPAVTALLVTNRLKHAMLLAVVAGVLPIAVDLHFSIVWDLPASALIVALSFLLLLPALAYRRLSS